MRQISRRMMLRGVLGGAAVGVGLPLLEVFLGQHGDALASGEAIPPRFGLFFWGNGILPERWVPTGEGADWVASDQLKPLERVRQHIAILSGMEVKTGNVIPHASGAAGVLSGAPLIVKSAEDSTFSAPSVDQIVAAAIGSSTRFQSLEFGAKAGAGLSYTGPYSRNPPETSPYQLFERLFGAGFRAPGDTSAVDPSIALRRSVLDAVAEDARALRREVGASDRQRLTQHFEGIRALELRLARLAEAPPMRAACLLPAAPEREYPDVMGRAQLGPLNRAMCDVLAMALACDQTRVFSNYLTEPVNNLLIGAAEAGHHQLTHDEPGDQPQVHAIVLQIMEELAYMIEALAGLPEGEGTVLDHCALLATTDVSYGRTHSLDEFPLIVAGRASGALRTGFHYRSQTRENASHAIYSLMRAVGVTREAFGEGAGRVTSGLSALEAL